MARRGRPQQHAASRRLPRFLTVAVLLYVAWHWFWLPRPPAAEAPPPDEDVPGFVVAFREGLVDWHDLFPDWRALGLDDPVAREATRAAQLDAILGGEGRWGVDHGGLRGAAACHLLRDKCAVHAASACAGGRSTSGGS